MKRYNKMLSLGVMSIFLINSCIYNPMAASNEADVFENLSKDEYVVMSRDESVLSDTINDVLPNQEKDIDTDIAVLELNKQEVMKLEENDFIVDSNAALYAFSDDNEQEYDYIEHEPIDEWNIYASNAQDYVNDEATKQIKIAILDSGVNYHPDILVEDWYDTLDNEKSAFVTECFKDSSGHGTAIASLINATASSDGIQGMNTDALLYSVRILDDRDEGTLYDVVEGINWAIENDMDIINMSFGMYHDSEILHKAIQNAYNEGILIVAAAGNTGNETVAYPAAYKEVISVGATTMQGTISESSARGKKVDLYAPGEEILVNAPLLGTQVVSGTSIACAEVSAAASVIWEKNPDYTAADIKIALEKSANFVVGNDAGILDVDAAVNYDTINHDDENSFDEERPIVVFDNESVHALWGNEGHRETVPSGKEARGYRLLYAASTFPDQPYMDTPAGQYYGANPMQKCCYFHGAGQYWRTITYLVDLAHAYYVGDQALIDEVQANASKKVESDIMKAVEIYLNNYKCFPSVDEKGVDERTNNSKAYKLMGIAIHTIGDTYAHRTIVTWQSYEGMPDSVKNELKKETKEEFKKLVRTNTLEFRKINTYFNVKIEDNPEIYKIRFNSAKDTIWSLVCNDGAYNFRKQGWKSDSIMVNYTILKQYDSHHY